MNTYAYSPFGELIVEQEQVALNIGFNTKYEDESGLIYYNNRYYDSDLGRFISQDPIFEEGGVNLYNFVENDPVNHWDILGYSPVSNTHQHIDVVDTERWVETSRDSDSNTGDLTIYYDVYLDDNWEGQDRHWGYVLLDYLGNALGTAVGYYVDQATAGIAGDVAVAASSAATAWLFEDLGWETVDYFVIGSEFLRVDSTFTPGDGNDCHLDDSCDSLSL